MNLISNQQSKEIIPTQRTQWSDEFSNVDKNLWKITINITTLITNYSIIQCTHIHIPHHNIPPLHVPPPVQDTARSRGFPP